jgi:hypothetical protein
MVREREHAVLAFGRARGLVEVWAELRQLIEMKAVQRGGGADLHMSRCFEREREATSRRLGG